MLFNLLLVLLVGSSAMAAAVIKPCPPATEIAPCTCLDGYDDFSIDCDASQSDGQQIRSILKYISAFGKINLMRVHNINQTFQTIPQDFMAGNQVMALYLSCTYGTTAGAPVLQFDKRAFASPDGTCSIIGDFQVQTCNMGHMDAGAFENCNQMRSLMIWSSNVQSFSNMPRLESLINFNIWSNSADEWIGSTGFVDVNISGSNLPNTRLLNLRGGHLEVDDIAFINDMSSVQEVVLERNNFTTSPDLSRARTLTSFHMNLDQPSKNVSIMLPTSRVNAFDFRLVSLLDDTYHISTLQGSFERINIGLYFKQDSFPEALFSPPLRDGATMFFDRNKGFPCGCDIAWLVRQPKLMDNIVGGMCENGLAFNQLDPAEFAQC